MSKVGHKPHNCFVVLLSRACFLASRSTCIDVVLFSAYHKMAEIEEEILKWTNQALAKIKALQQESNLTVFDIVNFEFFKTHGIMLVANNFGVDLEDNVNKLFRPLDCIDMEIMDEDIINVLLTKGRALWEPDGTCMAHNALLSCNTVNQSSTISLTKPWYGHVILATVVWVVLDQAQLSVPDAMSTLLDMAKNDQDGVAICYIPISKPFFSYPEGGPHILVLPYDKDILPSLGYGMPADFVAYEMTSYTTSASTAVGLTAQLQFGPKHPLSTEEKQTVQFLTVENQGVVWSNQTYVRQTAEGEANITHEVHLGDGVMKVPTTRQLNAEQHQQVIQAIAQNPTIVSCFKTAVSQSDGTEDPVHITLLGHEYSLQVSKDDWLASGQTSRTTIAKGTSATSQAYTPVQPTSSLPAAIPSVSTGGTSAIGPPPGFLILPEDPIKCQAVLREQIRADGKTLGKASRVLCNNFRHMGEYHSKQMKVMQECQLAGVHELKA